MHRNRRSQIAAALKATFRNPFAQSTRFAKDQYKPFIKKIQSEADLPQDWLRKPTSVSEMPAKRQKTGPDSYVTPQKARKDTPFISPVERKRKMSHRVEDETMEDDGLDPGLSLAATMSAQGGGKGIGQETPITPASPNYGIANTHTAILPWTGYFAMIAPALKYSPPTVFKFRLTSIYDIFRTAIAPPAPGLYQAGLWTLQMTSNSTATWPASAPTFPTTMGAGVNTSEAPQWRDYWAKMYQYYAVLGCEYEITFQNPQTNAAADVVVANFVDTYSAANATNVHPVNVSVEQMTFWNDVDMKMVRADGDLAGNNYAVVKGFYRAGSAHKNVENDEDVKTWTKVTQQPSLTEEMTVAMNKAWQNDTTAPMGANVRIKLRYIVQFKDVVNNYRWPASTQTPVTVSAPTDILSSV